MKRVKDTQNLRQRYRKSSRRGFQIISYMFNLNVKQALANQICCTHNVCIITQNDRKCQNASKCLLRNGTESNNTSSYILSDHSNAFNLSGANFFVENKLTRAYLKWGKGGGLNFSTIPPFGAPLHFDWNWHMHNLAMGPSIQDHNWVSMVFSYREDAITRFT